MSNYQMMLLQLGQQLTLTIAISIALHYQLPAATIDEIIRKNSASVLMRALEKRRIICENVRKLKEFHGVLKLMNYLKLAKIMEDFYVELKEEPLAYAEWANLVQSPSLSPTSRTLAEEATGIGYFVMSDTEEPLAYAEWGNLIKSLPQSPTSRTLAEEATGFGAFMVDLASYLPNEVTWELVKFFFFSPVSFERVEDNSLEFVQLLRDRRIITPSDISSLTSALQSIGQDGIATKVQRLFERHQRRDASVPGVVTSELPHMIQRLLNDALTREDCQNLRSHFILQTFENDDQNGNLSAKNLTHLMWQESLFTHQRLQALITGLRRVGRADLADKVGAIQNETEVLTTPYDTFIAHLSTHLTVEAVEVFCEYFEVSDIDKRKILSDPSPGISCLHFLHHKGFIDSSSVKALITPFTNTNMVQSVAKVREYEKSLEARLTWYKMQRSEITATDKFLRHLKAKLENWYEIMTPLPWKKSCKWKFADLFISRRLALEGDIPGRAGGIKINYSEIFKNEILQNEDRIIIDGEPGSGKTLLATQIAYDWCQGKELGVDVLVFMPLRLVEGMELSRAIKTFYVPEEDTTITENDIKNIITDEMLSCALVLDGLEEYTGGEIGNSRDSSEVAKIWNKEMYPKCKVAITARTDFAQNVKGCLRLKVEGFGEGERVEYIGRVFPDDKEKQDEISSVITNNELVRELCSTPLLFVLAVHHMGSKCSSEMDEFKHVTPFMNAMIEAVCPQNEILDDSSLQRLAFEGLCSGKQLLTWPKDFVTANVENASRFIDSGVLVIDESITSKLTDDEPKQTTYHVGAVTENETRKTTPTVPSASQTVRRTQLKGAKGHPFIKAVAETVPLRIRFLHKVVQEWYAAKYLSNLIPNEVNESLKKINPADLHFILRFTCGLNWKCTHLILHHLWSHHKGCDNRLPEYIEKIFYLCFLEHDIRKDSLKHEVAFACSKDISFSAKDNQFTVISKATLVKHACDLRIPIEEINLGDVKEIPTERKFVLTSNISLNFLPPSNELSIKLNDDAVISEYLEGITKMISEQQHLQQLTITLKNWTELHFDKKTLGLLKVRGTKVFVNDTVKNATHLLNTNSGEWKALQDITAKVDDIAQELDSHTWKVVGRELGLRRDILDNIENNIKNDLHQMKVAMIQKWRECKGRDATPVALISALRKKELNMAADNVSGMFGID